MCGIAGFVSGEAHEGLAATLAEMIRVQEHRGPDGQGAWMGRVGNFALGLGHLRLAILDVTEAGKQPMTLPDGSGAIIFNGEIYNYRELRPELEKLGASFRTGTDTEVLLWALRMWGERAVERLNGMWAFAWLDFRRKLLMLSRDRFGIKPLYYYRGGTATYFASEIKAILAAARRRFPVNFKVAGRFLAQGILDAEPQTFFDGIASLPPGHNAIFDLDRDRTPHPDVCRYWRAPLEDSVGEPVEKRIELLRETFLDAVRIRLRSDVPVGVLLSGGVDSSSIAAAMRGALGADADLHLLSATSDNPAYDERPFVETMARHLGSEVASVKLHAEPSEWFRLLEDVVYFNDEPVGNFSTVAHYLLMREARAMGVTVVLSGQGADELLCGYRKFLGFHLYDLLARGRVFRATRTLAGFVRNGTVLSQFELSEARRYLGAATYRGPLDIRGPRVRDGGFLLDNGIRGRTLLERQREDLERFSVPALVHYEDRSSMAWAREIRLPFLDYRLVEQLLAAPPDLKLRDGWTKWLFRKAIEPWVPREIAWRKDKQGFVTPQGEWLRHELRPAVSRMFSGDMLTAEAGIIDPKRLLSRYDSYCGESPGRSMLSFKDIFHPIALELWARRFESSLSLN